MSSSSCASASAEFSENKTAVCDSLAAGSNAVFLKGIDSQSPFSCVEPGPEAGVALELEAVLYSQVSVDGRCGHVRSSFRRRVLPWSWRQCCTYRWVVWMVWMVWMV